MRIGTHGSEGPTQAGARRRVSRVYQGAWRAGCGKAAASCLRKERRAGVVTGRLRDRHRRGAGKAPYLLLTRCRPGAPLPDFPCNGQTVEKPGVATEKRGYPSPSRGGWTAAGGGWTGGVRADERDAFAAPTRKPGKCRNPTTLKFYDEKAPRAAAATPPASLRSAPYNFSSAESVIVAGCGGGRETKAPLGIEARGARARDKHLLNRPSSAPG
jgi:hypothetical protein